MTPGARAQAAIELLEAIVVAARDGGAAADTIIARYFATRRYAGSKDRRAIRELVYAAIRRAGSAPPTGRSALVGLARDDKALARTFDGAPMCPAPITAGEPVATAGVAPPALLKLLAASGIDGDELPALIERAPLDVRINRRAESAPEIPGAAPIPGLPDALRLPAGTNVDPFAGLVEVQDAGSQIVTMAAQAKPGQAIVDLCAGAGGKTLALAATMDDRGAILACDVDRARLSRLEPRAQRAGVSIVEPRLLNPAQEAAALADWQGRADTVLIDAPCSGTGTWRRNPEARWRLDARRIARFVETQRHVLNVARPLVRPGGAIVYIVCSLLDDEGAGQVAQFLADHPTWQAEPLALPVGRPRGAGLRLTPAHDDTDGFFVARLRAPC